MGEIYVGTPKLKKLYAGVPDAKKIYIGTGTIWQGVVLVNKPSDLAPNRYYAGHTVTNGYNCPVGVTMVGTDRAVNGGVYTATYTPQEGYVWSDDGTQTPITVTLSIYYKWQKWNSVLTYVDSVEQFYSTTPFEYAQGISGGATMYYFDGTGYTFNPDTGIYTLTGYNLRSVNYGTHNYPSNIVTPPTTYSARSASANRIYAGSMVAINYSSAGNYAAFRGDGNVWKHSAVPTYSKGDTNYGIVYSTTLDYPENGRHTDGYWYVKTW